MGINEGYATSVFNILDDERLKQICLSSTSLSNNVHMKSAVSLLNAESLTSRSSGCLAEVKYAPHGEQRTSYLPPYRRGAVVPREARKGGVDE